MDSRWRAINFKQVPEAIKPWLQYEGSMTHMIQRATGKDVVVQVQQSKVVTSPRGLPKSFQTENNTFLREIALVAGSIRALRGLTFVQPETSLAQRIAALGNTPLGTLLFNERTLDMTGRTYIRLGEEYGRVSEWARHHESLLLVEFMDSRFVCEYRFP